MNTFLVVTVGRICFVRCEQTPEGHFHWNTSLVSSYPNPAFTKSIQTKTEIYDERKQLFYFPYNYRKKYLLSVIYRIEMRANLVAIVLFAQFWSISTKRGLSFIAQILVLKANLIDTEIKLHVVKTIRTMYSNSFKQSLNAPLGVHRATNKERCFG